MIDTKPAIDGQAPTHRLGGQPKDLPGSQIVKLAPATTLSTLWIFATLNYIYCDVVGVMDRAREFVSGNIAGIHITQGFLLASSVLVEIPMAMVVLARLLPYRANRLANVIAGAMMTVVQLATVFIGTPTPYYLFFLVIEIACTAAIVWYAWRWRFSSP